MENQNAKIDEMNELESVKALNEVSMELLRHKKADHTKLFVIIILLIVVNLIQCGLLVWLIIRDSDVVETVTTTETITQDTDGDGNNVYQSGENANYVQEGKTEVNDNGETDDSSQNNDNTIQAESSESKS